MQSSSSIHWNAYPALLACGVVSVGMCVAQLFDAPVWWWMTVATAGVFGAIVRVRSAELGGRSGLVTFAFLALFATGGLRYAEFARPARADVSFLPADSEVRLVGRPAEAAATRSGIRFVLDVDSTSADGIRLPFSGRVQVYVRDADVEDASPCKRIVVEGRLEELPRVRNPADFDYASYLRGRRVFSRMFADAMAVPSATASEFEPRGVLCGAHRLKRSIEGHFQRSVSNDAARSVIRALVVGDRSAIDGETEAKFRRSGLLHLLAVSGLHVLIVGMILYQLLRPAFLRLGFSWLGSEVARAAVTSIVLIFYALVTGLPASVVRAVIMAMLFMMGAAFQRTSHSLNTLGVAALLLLLWRPSQLFEPGFQLSVAAVAAIITLNPRFSALLGAHGDGGPFVRFLRSSVSVSMAAAAGTLPVLLFHFGSVSFAGLVLNTIAVPLTSATLASSVTTALASEASPSLGVTFGHASQFFAELLLYVVTHGEPYFRWAYLETRVEDAPVIAAIVAVVVMLAQWPRPRTRWRLCAAALSLLAIDVIWDAAEGEWRADVDIVFLDVGQGDAALVTFPNGRTMLVDAGPRTAFVDAARYTVLPHLRHRQIRRLDAVLITHPDSDHLGGLPTLLRNVGVGRVLHSGRSHDSALYGEVTYLVDSLSIPYQAIRAGDTLSLDPSVRIHILHPSRPRAADRPNASSLVMHVRYGETAALLMGDAERDSERELVLQYGDLAAADVIKVGHHGSKTSTTPLLISRIIRPHALAVVSAGERNRFGHPDSVVVRRLRRHGVDVHRTDQQGAVWIRSDGRRFTARSWR